MKINKKIAICIPTFNEQKTISNTTKIINEGLKYLSKKFQTFIVNCDNYSDDNTKQEFLNTETRSTKIYISTKKGKIGKGRNLFNFFEYCKKNNIDYAATIDADIKTLKSDWIKRLIDPIITNKADYVAPLYKRNRFEGSTTNNFAVPIVFAYFGVFIRQPIGGDFGFNKKVYLEFLSQKRNLSTLNYGIDIFMTLNTISNKNKIKQVLLGEKIHNPSFSNMTIMSKQVANSAFYLLDFLKPNLEKTQKIKIPKNLNIIEHKNFPHKKEAEKLLIKNLVNLKKNKDNYQKFSFHNLILKIIKNKSISVNDWSTIICKLVISTKTEKSNILSDLFSPLFIIRAVDFWLRSEKMSAKEIENEIYNLAKLCRKKFLIMTKPKF